MWCWAVHCWRCMRRNAEHVDASRASRRVGVVGDANFGPRSAKALQSGGVSPQQFACPEVGGGLLHSSQITRWSINTSYQLPVPPLFIPDAGCITISRVQPQLHKTEPTNPTKPIKPTVTNPSRRGLNPLLVYNQRPTPPFSPSGRYCVQYTARPAPHTTRDSSGYELDIRRPSTSTKPSAFRNSYWHGSRAAANPSPASPA